METSKIKQILAITGLSLLLFAIVSLSTVATAIATAESATRTLPAEPVSAGELFAVSIEASGYGTMGQVVETLPAGFKYATSTLDPSSVDVVGNTVKFYLLGECFFNYTVIASETEGTYYFSGTLIKEDKGESEVDGAKEIKVEPAKAIATRTLPAEPVSPSGNFTIGIEASGYGTMGQVVETLPVGFRYVKSTLDPGSVEVVAETVTFTLFGETSFNYTMTVSDLTSTYAIKGMLVDMDRKEYGVGGDTKIVVKSARATRTLLAEPVAPGANFTVGIDVSGYGSFGQVIETLPEGFICVASSLNPESVEVINNTVKFILLGETSFNYTVTASDIVGTYNFSGMLLDMNEKGYEIGRDTKLVVEKEEETAIATRTLPAEPLSPSTKFTIGIEASDYGTFGQVLETLPEGFVYVDSTLDPGSVVVKNSTVRFTLFGESSFNYSALASDTTGTYNFSGVLKDVNMNAYVIGGDTEVVVGATLSTLGIVYSIEPKGEL
jgi:DNA mismatch repair protein MutH